MYCTYKFSDENSVQSWDSTNVFTFSNNNKSLIIYDDFEKSGTSFPDDTMKAQYGVYKRVND